MEDPKEQERRVEDHWPGLDRKHDEIVHSAERLKSIAKALNDGLERLRGVEMGSLQDLHRRARLVNPVPQEDWKAGQAVFESADNAFTSITHIYGQIIQRYSAAVALVDAGADVHGTTEQINTRRRPA